MSLDHRLRQITLIICTIGLVDALYLTWIKLTSNESSCLPGIGNCERVNTSSYATFAGIPTAAIGALAYITFIVLISLENRPGFFKDYSKMIVFAFGIIGVIYSAYLTYLELAVIHAICPFCVLSAIAMLLIFGSGTYRLISNQATTQP